MAIVGRQAERRKRWARFLVASAVVVTVGVVLEAYRKRSAGSRQVAPKVTVLPKGVHQELSRFTYTRSEGGRKVFTIRARKTLALQKGHRAVLQDVTVEFFGRSGQQLDLLRTRQAEYDSRSGDFSSSGQVVLQFNVPSPSHQARGQRTAGRSPVRVGFLGPGPFELKTSKISYDHRQSLLATPAPVRFTTGALFGSAVGMTYDTRSGVLELQHQVQMVLHPTAGARLAAPIQLTADWFRYERHEDTGEFGGLVRICEADLTAMAAHAHFSLNSRNRVTQILLSGSVKIVQSSPNGVTRVQADQLLGKLDPTTEQLLDLWAHGQVRASSLERSGASFRLVAERGEIQLRQGKPVRGNALGQVKVGWVSRGKPEVHPQSGTLSKYGSQELIAKGIAFAFQPPGKSLQEATTQGPAELRLSPKPGTPEQEEIQAGQFKFWFDARNQLESLAGSAGTRIETPAQAGAPGNSLGWESSARRLLAHFDPTTETLESAEQEGDFHFERGNEQARARRATYTAANEVLLLTGRPKAWDPKIRVEARQIGLNQKNNAIEGIGQVQVSYGEPTKGSALPSHILADRFDTALGGKLLRFVGNVRAWHGDDVVEAPEVRILRADRVASAGPSVVSTYLASGTLVGPDPAIAPQARRPQWVTIRASHLDYSDLSREARYVGHVVMKTRQATLRADRIIVHLAPVKGSESLAISQAIAEGHVRATQPGRWAKGERAVYEAATGQIQMTGGSPTLYDAQRGLTTGRRLTFWTRNDTVRVDEGRNFTRLPKPPAAP